MKHIPLTIIAILSFASFGHAESEENTKPTVKELESIIAEQRAEIESLQDIQIPPQSLAEINDRCERLQKENFELSQALASIEPAALEKAGIYLIRAGDTLKKISTKTKLKIEDIKKLNPKMEAMKLRVGQILRIKPDKSSNAE